MPFKEYLQSIWQNMRYNYIDICCDTTECNTPVTQISCCCVTFLCRRRFFRNTVYCRIMCNERKQRSAIIIFNIVQEYVLLYAVYEHTYKLCANGCCDSRIKNYSTRWSFFYDEKLNREKLKVGIQIIYSSAKYHKRH